MKQILFFLVMLCVGGCASARAVKDAPLVYSAAGDAEYAFFLASTKATIAGYYQVAHITSRDGRIWLQVSNYPLNGVDDAGTLRMKVGSCATWLARFSSDRTVLHLQLPNVGHPIAFGKTTAATVDGYESQLRQIAKSYDARHIRVGGFSSVLTPHCLGV